MTPAAESFGAFVAQQHAQALPPAVAHHAKRALVDWHAALYPGLGTPAVRALEAVLADELGCGPARLADGRAASVRAAALLQGAAAHAAELDDSLRDAMVHPGAATIAAALAAGQAAGAGGAELLRAIAVGYEVAGRIGRAMGAAHYRHWHATGTVGSFGAAAAAACLYKLDAPAAAHTLAMVATFSAGLQQAFRRDAAAKPLHAGRAAEAGVLAARLAAQGLTSSLDVLDGEAGYGRALGDGADWAGAVEGLGLGAGWMIERTTFKNHVGCGHAFAAIDGALALQAAHGFVAGDIARVELGVYGATLAMAGHADPRTADEARFSLPYLVATALVHGRVRLAAFSPERLADPATRALMARTEAAVDPGVDAGFPARRAARVVVTLRDGRRCERLQPDRQGDPELPLADTDLDAKLLELAGPVLGDAGARALAARLWRIEALHALDALGMSR